MDFPRSPTMFRSNPLAFAAALVLAFVVIPVGVVRGQDVSGDLEGVVATQDGKPVSGAEVTVLGPVLQQPRTVRTDADGRFRVLALPIGTYVVQVRHPDFQPEAVKQVTVHLGRTTSLPPRALRPRVELEEHVVVTAPRPLIDPVSTTGGGNIDETYFGNLPVERNYQSIATLLPNANVSFFGDGVNFGGATGIENRYFIDGMEVTDPYRGLGGTNLPQDFIQEVEVKTGGYQAEYRSALGGLVNVVTPSGGDRLTGKFFAYFANDRFSGGVRQGIGELETSGFKQYDVGFTLSGPLAGERLRFFMAYNPAFEGEDVVIPGLGSYTDQSTAHRFAGKLGWQLNPANTLVFTVIGDPTTRDSVGETWWRYGTATALLNPDPFLGHIERGGMSISAQGTHVVKPDLLLESWISGLKRNDDLGPATARGREEALFIDAETGVWSGGFADDMSQQSTQLTAGIKATWLLRRHEVKGGVEYRDSGLKSDNSVRALWRYSDVSFQAWEWMVKGTVHNRVSSVFLQDSWRATDRLTLNLGLRWDGQELVATDGTVAQTINDQYQPRIGFAYEPGQAGMQRIFGSAARYYQDLHTALGQFYHTGESLWRLATCDHDPRLDLTGCDVQEIGGTISPAVEGLRGQYFDEFTLGYERRVGEKHKFRARGSYRALREAIDDALDTGTGEFTVGNPGRGALEEYPSGSRTQQALELTFERQAGGRLGYLVSYVLSRNRGNYTGLYSTDFDLAYPNTDGQWDIPALLVNAEGLMPNDRTHVFKASGFYRFDVGLNVGSSLTWASGTPLSEMGGCPSYLSGCFVSQRGTAGRTPSIFDLNLRFDYAFLRDSGTRWRPRLYLDVFHLFSQRQPVEVDQLHYFNVDDAGNQIDPNPTYGMATRYFPPTSVRLGMEVTF